VATHRDFRILMVSFSYNFWLFRSNTWVFKLILLVEIEIDIYLSINNLEKQLVRWLVVRTSNPVRRSIYLAWPNKHYPDVLVAGTLRVACPDPHTTRPPRAQPRRSDTSAARTLRVACPDPHATRPPCAQPRRSNTSAASCLVDISMHFTLWSSNARINHEGDGARGRRRLFPSFRLFLFVHRAGKLINKLLSNKKPIIKKKES
jgi:hypothetical protein